MRTLERFLIAGLTVAVAACGSNPSDVGCTLQGTVPILMEIRDANSGLPAATGVTGTYRVGGVAGEIFVHSDGLHAAVEDAPAGLYVVTLAREGYQTLELTDLEVQGVACGVETLELQVSLVPNEAP